MTADDWRQVLEAISQYLWPILVAIGTGFWFAIGEIRKWRKEAAAITRAQCDTEIGRALAREKSAVALAEELRDREIAYLRSEVVERDEAIARLREKLSKREATAAAIQADRDRAKIESANFASENSRLRRENRALQAALLRIYVRVPDAFGQDTMLLLPGDPGGDLDR